MFKAHDRERVSCYAQLKPLPQPELPHDGPEDDPEFEAAKTESSLRVWLDSHLGQATLLSDEETNSSNFSPQASH